VAETALACALLVQAGLLTRSLLGLLAVEPGFETRSAMTIALSLPDRPFAEVDLQTTALGAALEAASRTTGVSAAGAISDFPMSGAINSTNTPVVGQTAPYPRALVRAVHGDYFRAMGVAVVRGRAFGAADDRHSAPVAVVNATFMERVFGGGDPIGRRVLVRGVEREVVGVVRSVREFGLTGDWDATLYTPYGQEREDWMRRAMTLVALTSAPPASIAAGLRTAVVGATPGLPVGDARPIADHLERHLALPRLQAGLIAAFAVMAMVLAAVGLAGVMACAVSERLREIAIRLALGARPSDVARLVVGQSLALTAAGVAGGLLLGWWMSRWLAELLVGVEATDAVVFASAAGILLAAGGAASWLPTRRAAAVDPTTALKQ
jgi:predicted permease